MTADSIQEEEEGPSKMNGQTNPLLPMNNECEFINLCHQTPSFTSTTLPRPPPNSHTLTPFVSTTLPKPPLKGILKNSNQPQMNSSSQLDVAPFDNAPPCDDCMQQARLQGSYSGQCTKVDCAFFVNRPQMQRQSSVKSLRSIGQSVVLQPMTRHVNSNGFETTAFRGSQESLLSNLADQEVLENVESSV